MPCVGGPLRTCPVGPLGEAHLVSIGCILQHELLPPKHSLAIILHTFEVQEPSFRAYLQLRSWKRFAILLPAAWYNLSCLDPQQIATSGLLAPLANLLASVGSKARVLALLQHVTSGAARVLSDCCVLRVTPPEEVSHSGSCRRGVCGVSWSRQPSRVCTTSSFLSAGARFLLVDRMGIASTISDIACTVKGGAVAASPSRAVSNRDC